VLPDELDGFLVIQQQDAVAYPGGDDAGKDLPGELCAEQLAQVDANAQAAALEITQRGQVPVEGGEV